MVGFRCGILESVFGDGVNGTPTRLGMVRVPPHHPWFDLPNHHPALAELRGLAWIPVSARVSDAREHHEPARCLGVLTFPGNLLQEALHGSVQLAYARRVLQAADLVPDDDVAYTLASAMAVVLAVASRRDATREFIERCLRDVDARVREYAMVRLLTRLPAPSSNLEAKGAE